MNDAWPTQPWDGNAEAWFKGAQDGSNTLSDFSPKVSIEMASLVEETWDQVRSWLKMEPRLLPCASLAAGLDLRISLLLTADISPPRRFRARRCSHAHLRLLALVEPPSLTPLLDQPPRRS